jgi:glycosyltransferase involved in cell wall biosynthesis
MALTGMRGGEKCLEVLCRRWPSAPLFTLLHRAGAVSGAIERRTVRTSFLQALPAAHRYYRYLLPIMPAAVTSWRLPRCELVVSFSHCVAKAARPPQGVPHVCYCFTPMRYAWHQCHAYFEGYRGLKASTLAWFLQRLRDWDRRTAERVTHFVAISRTVQQRIAECYSRQSKVIYPPADTAFFCPAPLRREDFYLAVSAFAPYKRLDLAIAACNKLKRPLLIIGAGQNESRLRALAGPGITFLGRQSDTVIRDYYRRCRALLFPGEEDFGIVPVEAQACGAPVIAFGRGGATETVIPLHGRRDPTGLWFDDQTVDSVASAIVHFEKHAGDFSPGAARRQALPFNQRRFDDEFMTYLMGVLQPEEATARQAA